MVSAGDPAVKVHPHLAAPKTDAFNLESTPLLPAFLTREGDPSSRGDHSVPREVFTPLKRPNRQAGRARESRILCRVSVRDDPAMRHLTKELADFLERGHRPDLHDHRHRTA